MRLLLSILLSMVAVGALLVPSFGTNSSAQGSYPPPIQPPTATQTLFPTQTPTVLPTIAPTGIPTEQAPYQDTAHYVYLPVIRGGVVSAIPPQTDGSEYVFGYEAFGGAPVMAARNSSGALFIAYVGESHQFLDPQPREFRARLLRVQPGSQRLTTELTRTIPARCQSTARPALVAAGNDLYWSVAVSGGFCAGYPVPQWRSSALLSDDSGDGVPWPFE